MKRWTNNLFLDALYKTVVLWLIIHVIFWIAGYYWGGSMSILGFTMLWPHLETSIWGWITGIVGMLVVFGGIYAYDASKEAKERDGEAIR